MDLVRARLRPFAEPDLELFDRFATDPRLPARIAVRILGRDLFGRPTGVPNGRRLVCRPVRA
jgi:hypothetical protein